ncbi:MAG: hypothetical protein LUD18_13710 [Lachnospiraceae bacterium]|nr:hypothetical protein [Lachnospiraceae bacterium]
MKKKISLFLFIMCAFCMLAGFPAAAEEENLLKEIEEANVFETIVSANGQMTFTQTEFLSDGTESVTSYYVDDEWYVLEDEYGVLIFDEDGNVYAIETDGTPFRYLFVGNLYDSFRETWAWMTNCFTYNEDEQILSEESADGLLYLETTIPGSENLESLLLSLGYEAEGIDSEFTEYVVDEETKEILEIRCYAVSGEEKTLIAEGILDTDCEEYTLDEDAEEAFFGEAVNTISVITDAGTDEEQTYTLELADGCAFAVYGGEEFEETLYTDPECTVEQDGTETERVYYLKRVEEEESTEASGEDGSEEAEADLLAEMEDANTFEALVAKYGRISYSDTEYYSDGTELPCTIYQDDTLYVVEYEEYLLIDEDGDIYGRDGDGEEAELFRNLYIGDYSYEDFREEAEYTSFYVYDENEQITSEETADGLIYLETILDMTEEELEACADYFEYEEADSVIMEYVIEEETKEILEQRTYIVSGEEQILCEETILDREAEEYIVDEELYESIFGEDTRTVTVITDAGTDDEKTYSMTVAKGCSVRICYNMDEFEEAYYTDSECTVERTEEEAAERTEDITLYMKRVEE